MLLIPARSYRDHPRPEALLFHVGANESTHAHLPGAAYLDTNWLEAGPFWKRRPPAEIRALLLSLGITSTREVVLYARDNLAASRAAVIFLSAGVRHVRLLDGGLGTWTAAGGAITSGPWATPTPARHFGAAPESHPEFWVERGDLGPIVLSVRSGPEHRGEVSGYPHIQAKGEIPGARWVEAGHDAHDMRAYRNPDGTMLTAEGLAALWRPLGLRRGQPITFYCGTAWRACEAFLTAYVRGWPHLKIYDGGWSEWSHHEGTSPAFEISLSNNLGTA